MSGETVASVHACPETYPPPDATPRPIEDLTDRELLEQISRQLAHQDILIHPIHQLAQKAAPLLERWSGVLGSPVRDYLRSRKGGRGAVPGSERTGTGTAGSGGPGTA
jgi:hypothetical protein